MTTLTARIRRMGHLLENHPGNLGQLVGTNGTYLAYPVMSGEESEPMDTTFAAMSGEAPAYPVESGISPFTDGMGGGGHAYA